MPSPFPGMNPYLESPGLWGDVHAEMIRDIRAALNPQVRPKYIVQIETRIYVTHEDDIGRRLFIPNLLVERPRPKRVRTATNGASALIDEPLIIPYVVDPNIEEGYLVIKERKSNRLITAIEVPSPANKVRGSEGRRSYMEKRAEFVASDVHIIEIDLLRAGDPPIVPLLTQTDYRIFQSRAHDRTRQRCWLVNVRDPLPVIGIPLREDDADVPLNLSELLQYVYDSGGYEDLIDYRKPCDPPLKPADARWAKKLLKDKGVI